MVMCNGLANKLFSQEKTRIRIINADEISYDRRIDPNNQQLVGDVILEHDSIYLYCDSALLNDRTNQVEAFNNVRIRSGDTLNLYGEYLKYNGDTKIAEMHDSVRLIDKQSTLKTNHLIYYRHTGIAKYTNGGLITNKENTLFSSRGYYYTKESEFYFSGGVNLLNPDYSIKSDTMMYNTETEIAYFLGPTDIMNDENKIYCEYGWYNTILDISEYSINARIETGEQILYGDTIFYDQKKGYGRLMGNIQMIDTVENMILKGHYAIYDKKNQYSMITDSALAILTDSKDSLYLHADTLLIWFDSTETATALSAYYKTKFYRKDIQGMCDSLFYNFADSTITLYEDPVLWSEDNQLTADSISILIKNGEVHRMNLYNTSMIISKDDTSTFNQIRGINMTGYFTDNDLTKIVVAASSETLYFIREEDSTLIGINKVKSGNMKIELIENEIDKITYIGNPTAVLYPENEVGEADLLLKGFVWMEDRRPMNKFAVFTW